MLARVEVRVLFLLLVFEFLEQLLFLLFSQFLAINATVLFLDFRNLLFILLLLLCLYSTWSFLKLFRCLRFDVVLRRGKVYLNVCLNAADLVIGLGFNDIN